MFDSEKELSIMKRRILILEQSIDELEKRMKQKDNEVEELKKAVQSIRHIGINPC